MDNPNSPSQVIPSLNPNASASKGVGKYSNLFVNDLTEWPWAFRIHIPIPKHCWSRNNAASILYFTYPSNGGCHRTSCWLLLCYSGNWGCHCNKESCVIYSTDRIRCCYVSHALLFLRRQMHHSIIAISLQTFSGNLHTKKREQTRCKTSSSIMYNIPHTRLLPNSICLITSNKHMPVILIVFFAMRTNIGTLNSPPSTIYMHWKVSYNMRYEYELKKLNECLRTCNYIYYWVGHVVFYNLYDLIFLFLMNWL